MRILVVEDEKKLAGFVKRALKEDGHAVDLVHDGDEAAVLVRQEEYDAIVLDLQLPGRDGMTILEDLRERKKTTPVLVLTARDTLEDRITGLDQGADDYLVKPFAFAEVLARIRALVRRGRVAEARRLAVGDLEVDLVMRKVSRAGETVDLTVREFELLEYLLRHQGQVVSREALAREVWKETARTTPAIRPGFRRRPAVRYARPACRASGRCGSSSSRSSRTQPVPGPRGKRGPANPG